MVAFDFIEALAGAVVAGCVEETWSMTRGAVEVRIEASVDLENRWAVRLAQTVVGRRVGCEYNELLFSICTR